MTLVVARIHDDRVAIVSDTLLTEHVKPLPLQRGCLKSWIFPGNICVSFCNSPDLAEIEFKRFLALQLQKGFTEESGIHCDFAETVSFFEGSSEKTGNDYIIAFDAPPRLIKITDGKRRVTVAKTVWIGDQAAYVAFREHEANLRSKAERGRAISTVLFADEPTGSPASDIYSVFRHVIADKAVPSVGGLGCVISNRGNGFRFSVYSDMLYDWPALETEDYELSYTDKINLVASGENAGYAIAQLSPSYIGINSVSFYFVKSKMLFVYYGEPHGLANKCHVLRSVEPNDIQATLNRFFGVDLGWLALVASAPNIQSSLLNSSNVEKRGIGFSFFVNANTFPKKNPPD